MERGEDALNPTEEKAQYQGWRVLQAMYVDFQLQKGRNPLGGTWSYLRKNGKAKPFDKPNSVVLEPSYLSWKLLSYFRSDIQHAPANSN